MGRPQIVIQRVWPPSRGSLREGAPAECFSCNTALLVAMIDACGGSGEGGPGTKT
jgi:hypothetical protein